MGMSIYIAAVFLMFTLSCFGQNMPAKKAARRDSASTNNILENQRLKLELMPGENLYPGYNSLNYNPEIYYKLNKQPVFLSLHHIPGLMQDPLANYKRYMSDLLAIEYKDFNKYDLGMVSRYLGISKKVFAIILAILSLK